MFEECSLECLATFPECFMTFLGIFCNIPRNILRHSPECLATFPECFMTFLGIFYDIPQNVWQHSWEFLRIFTRMFVDIPQNVSGHSPESVRTFPGMFDDIPWNVWQHSPEYSISPILRVPRIPFPVPVFLFFYTAGNQLSSKCHVNITQSLQIV